MSTPKKIQAGLFLFWLFCALCWTMSSLPFAPAPLTAFAGKTAPTSMAEHIKIGETDCTDCHGDLTEHKNVHPVAVDCSSCHVYSETEEKADVKLLAEGNALCLTCHSEKEEDLAKQKFKHDAAESDCTFCHDPHASDEPVLLKDKSNQLCFICHSDKEEELTEKAFTHAPTKDVGCITCHNPHTANFPSLLKAGVNDLCLSCHGISAKKNKTSRIILSQRLIPKDYADKAKKVLLGRDGKGHPYIGHPVGGVPDPSNPKENMSCLSCHGPHAGKFVQMYKGDVNKGELCDRCHKQR